MKLTDLLEQELADLLDLPLDKARKWLEIAQSMLLLTPTSPTSERIKRLNMPNKRVGVREEDLPNCHLS